MKFSTLMIIVFLGMVAYFVVTDSEKRAAEKEHLEQLEKERKALADEMIRARNQQLDEEARAARAAAAAEDERLRRTPPPRTGAWMTQDRGNPLERAPYDQHSSTLRPY